MTLLGMTASHFNLKSVQLAFKQGIIDHMAYYVLLPVSAISVIDTIAVEVSSVGYCLTLPGVRCAALSHGCDACPMLCLVSGK